jgi:hypothetical protein
MDWQCGTNSRAPALPEQGPEFKLQSQKKIKKKKKEKKRMSKEETGGLGFETRLVLRGRGS